MYCENCGNKIENKDKFCMRCGHSIINEDAIETTAKQKENVVPNNESRWHRLFKVAYIFLYVFLLIIIPGVWSENSSSYTYSYIFSRGTYENTYGKAFWYSLLTLIIYLAVIRIIKIIFLYIVYGIKPEWKKEFKRFY